MITWLQTFFLKHNKWLFGVLLIVIIVTFVLTIGPQSFFGGPSLPDRRDLDYFGYNLSSNRDQQALFRSAEISASLHPELGIRRDQVSDYAYMRAAGLGIADQMGIPRPTAAQMEKYVRQMVIFQDPESGEFSAESYNQMLAMLAGSVDFSRDAVARVLRQDWRLSRVRKALGGPGVELPWEQKQNFIAQQTNYDIQFARTSYHDFRPELTPDEEELRDLYASNPDRYAISDRIRVRALFFMPERYKDKVEIADDSVLKAFFDRNRFRYENEREERLGEDEIAEDLPPLTLDDVRDQVEQEYRSEQAQRLAGKRAEEFSLALWERGIRLEDVAFADLVEEFGVEEELLEPYSRNRPPSHRRISRQMLNSMWIYAAGGTRYFSDIGQISAGGAYLLIFEELLPERLPPFEEVREQVTSDWRSETRRRMFSEHGDTLRAELKEEMASAGLSFQEAAEELGLRVETFAAFSGADLPSSVASNPAWAQGRYLPEGAVSRMHLEADFGTFLYMKRKDVPEVDFDSEAFRVFVDQQEDLLRDAKGWARLREITDRTLEEMMGPMQAFN